MKLFVLMKDGQPFELPVSDAETVNHLMDYDGGAEGMYAFASTDRDHVEVMRQALPDFLDSDRGSEQFTIAEFVCVVPFPS